MKTILCSVFIIISFFEPCCSQAWTYSKGGDPFDGEFRTSSVIGSSDDITYKTPIFVVNNFNNTEKFNVYLGSIGFVCDNLKLKIKFDGDDVLYYANVSSENKKETIFFQNIYFYSEQKNIILLSKFEFLDLIKKGTKMYFRIEDDCDITNCEFLLSGSTKAINYVYGDKLSKIEKGLKAMRDRGEIQPGPALMMKSPESKYMAIHEFEHNRGKVLARITETVTVEIISIGESEFQIITKDGITGWCNKNYIFPL